MKFIIGIDVACRAAHVAAGANQHGEIQWSGVRLRTCVEDLEELIKRVPDEVDELVVVMEPTRNAWVPLASWLRRHGASVLVVPPEQSADLRAYFSKHTKNDRLDAQLLARLPSLHPEGLHASSGLGPADSLRRAVRQRTSLVERRSVAMARLDALLEIMGPGWSEALGTALTTTGFAFLARWAHPHQVLKVGRARLARWFCREMRRTHGADVADRVIEAARATLALWGEGGLDFDELAADIASEAEVALELSRQITELDRRIADLYDEVDSDHIAETVPGIGKILAAQAVARLGDVHRFSSLAAVRSFSGLVPRQNASGLMSRAGGPTKRGDAALRGALFQAVNVARQIDPTLAQRYHRLMVREGKHHNSATCTVAAVLLTRLATCLRTNTSYVIRDLDGRVVTAAEGREIVRALPGSPPGPRGPPGSPRESPGGRAHHERSRQALRGRARPRCIVTPQKGLDNA